MAKKNKKKNKQNANPSQNNTAIPTNEVAIPTAAEAGQEAAQTTITPPAAGVPTLDQAMRSQNEALAKQAEIGSQQYQVQEVLGKLLEAKKNTTPHVKKIARIQKNLGKSKTFSQYVKEGMTIDQAIELTNAQVSRAQSRVSFLNMKREEEEQSVAETIQSVTDHLNSQLAALGLQIEASQIQKQDALTMMSLSGGGGGGGRGGGGSRGGSSSGGGEDNTERQQKFQSDAGYMITQFDKGLMTWSGAWNALKTEYPEMSNDAINNSLKGSWNPETGENKGYAATAQSAGSDSGGSSITLPD